jgi:serine/threonine protein kinase
MLQPGQRIVNGKYQLLRELGSGSFGQVWLALEVRSNTRVAIKVARSDDPEAADRFNREMKASRKLDHPHLLCAETVEEEGDALYLVFPYAAGGSLQARLAGDRRLSIEEAMHIALAVAQVLGYLHDNDLVHRDVHPGNILFAADGVVKLGDLGLVQSHMFNADLFYGREVHEQQPGNMLYLPPEAWRAPGRPLKPLLPAADVYMLGAVLWQMLTGRVYYHHQGRSVRALRPEVPVHLDELVMRCLAEDAAARPCDGNALAELLQDALARLEQERGARVNRRARMLPVLLGGVVGLTVILVLVTAAVWAFLLAGRCIAHRHPRGARY